MFENERKYFVENVITSYKEYFDHRKSNKWGENQLLRKGMNAANALFHFRDHLPAHIRPSKNSLKGEYPDYGILADIANAAKHKIIHNDNPRVSNASQVYEVLTSTFFTDEHGEYSFPQLEVYVKLDDGSEINFSELLHSVMSMWLNNLRIWKIIDIQPFPEVGANEIVSRDDAEKRSADLQITRGEDYHWNFRIRKYNYDKKMIEPMDLTGASVGFRIYEPPTHIPIHISISDSKIELDFDVPLTDEQSHQYVKLSTADERLTFLQSIIGKNIEIQKAIQIEIIKISKR
jgi:hypothetical protein